MGSVIRCVNDKYLEQNKGAFLQGFVFLSKMDKCIFHRTLWYSVKFAFLYKEWIYICFPHASKNDVASEIKNIF